MYITSNNITKVKENFKGHDHFIRDIALNSWQVNLECELSFSKYLTKLFTSIPSSVLLSHHLSTAQSLGLVESDGDQQMTVQVKF